jgi:hypothetical protein
MGSAMSRLRTEEQLQREEPAFSLHSILSGHSATQELPDLRPERSGKGCQEAGRQRNLMG